MNEKCRRCGCNIHCGISCQECLDCPDCECSICDKFKDDGIEHTKEYYDRDRNK